MTGLVAAATPIDLIKPVATLSAAKSDVMTIAETEKRAAIHKTAVNFEASFLTSMLSQMFEGVETDAPFGGGAGEAAYKSFLTEGYAKQLAKSGGVGVSKAVERQMLKMQGLS
ncbi:MAG: rod-binding protein [Caulobacteraceae bacterium]|nr:rod-binding protein [Caulobacteraceae bacterium]